MIVVGVTGTIWAGKWAIVEYLVQRYGFQHFSFRTLLVEKIRQQWWEVNRDTMKIMADSLRDKFGPGYMADELYAQAIQWKQNAVLESIRALGEVETLRKKEHFILFSVDANPSLRYQRVYKRGNETDHIAYPKFLSDEQREFANIDPTQWNIQWCMQVADFSFDNNGTLEALHQQIDEVMKKIVERPDGLINASR